MFRLRRILQHPRSRRFEKLEEVLRRSLLGYGFPQSLPAGQQEAQEAPPETHRYFCSGLPVSKEETLPPSTSFPNPCSKPPTLDVLPSKEVYQKKSTSSNGKKTFLPFLSKKNHGIQESPLPIQEEGF
ncbi:MAG TPA: hypothetical protein P5201_02610 [Aminobacteriaceae bacterium]|nr:hypothetical protein [Aminobacteriaceae bacterium]